VKETERRVDFLTARQLAEILQVSETTIHRLRRSGRIPAIKVTSRLIRFNLREVKAALAGSAKKPHDDDKDLNQLSFEEVFAGFSS
jgi:excisionase family DNA binding protein